MKKCIERSISDKDCEIKICLNLTLYFKKPIYSVQKLNNYLFLFSLFKILIFASNVNQNTHHEATELYKIS